MQLNEILSLCVQHQASDLHIVAGMPPVLRVEGNLVILQDFPDMNAAVTQNLICGAMDQVQQQNFAKELELDFAIPLPGVARFRVNAYHERCGVAAAFRLIPEVIRGLDVLEMPSIFKQLLQVSHGLILVAGSTGSGKSTTLAAMIDHINTHQSSHIITIEDPIEFIHHNKKSLINQRQVSRDTHDFNNALRAALRQDPDVILIGELRDLETIRLALTAAETGHLVMATLHTNSAPRAISRIVDVFPSGEKNIIRNMLSESLQAVVCQTLVKRKVQGRIAAFEIMLASPAIRNLIREDKISQMYSVIQTSAAQGMCTLEQYLQELAVNQK